MHKLDVDGMGTYLAAWGACLARAHARTGDSAWISAYLGSGTVFDQAIANFLKLNVTSSDREGIATPLLRVDEKGWSPFGPQKFSVFSSK
jgi:Uncharacterized protein conserved in bacteria (DUF2252)